MSLITLFPSLPDELLFTLLNPFSQNIPQPTSKNEAWTSKPTKPGHVWRLPILPLAQAAGASGAGELPSPAGLGKDPWMPSWSACLVPEHMAGPAKSPRLWEVPRVCPNAPDPQYHIPDPCTQVKVVPSLPPPPCIGPDGTSWLYPLYGSSQGAVTGSSPSQRKSQSQLPLRPCMQEGLHRGP
uniref:Uncharacterized protein n=1 Tax=Myotis myotis TaxID=51298 RepID=A0A7J7XIR3_MYOMY|nr:hypothetical protein mMyoMyo1_011793 [Myotis myotis]